MIALLLSFTQSFSKHFYLEASMYQRDKLDLKRS